MECFFVVLEFDNLHNAKMAGFALKIKSKNGQNVLKNLTSKSTVADLKTALVSATNINKNYLNILYGFPPKPLSLSSNDCTLEQCGIVSGKMDFLLFVCIRFYRFFFA